MGGESAAESKAGGKRSELAVWRWHGYSIAEISEGGALHVPTRLRSVTAYTSRLRHADDYRCVDVYNVLSSTKEVVNGRRHA